MSRRLLAPCALLGVLAVAAAYAADHGDKPVTPGFIQALNRLCDGRVAMTWDLVRDETGKVSGITPCIAPTPGLSVALGLLAGPGGAVPDGVITVPPDPIPPDPIVPPSPIRVQVNDPTAFAFFDRAGNPLMLVPAR